MQVVLAVDWRCFLNWRGWFVGFAAACLVLGACSSDGDDVLGADPTAPVVQIGGPGETSRVLSPEEVDDLPAPPPFSEADVAFAQGMIHHHQQALEMAALVEERAGRDDLTLFAERISVGQQDEIALLERWLTERGAEVPTHEGGHGELMPGMLTDDEMAALESARGDEFDVLFLTSMTRHHEGAIAMVQELYRDGGGQEPEMFQLAEGMATDQSVEIARMRSVLAELVPPTSTTEP